MSALSTVCESPNFNVENSVSNLRQTVNEFGAWLTQEPVIEKVWFPSINRELDVSIKRSDFLTICGTISKHNFTHLTRVAERIAKILKRNDIDVSLAETLTILDEFYERFYTDIFSYHVSTIAEFMNDVRWGIYRYLQPEFTRSLVRESERYTFPDDVKHDYAKKCYWDLMNDVRRQPYMPEFRVSKYLKMRYRTDDEKLEAQT